MDSRRTSPWAAQINRARRAGVGSEDDIVTVEDVC